MFSQRDIARWAIVFALGTLVAGPVDPSMAVAAEPDLKKAKQKFKEGKSAYSAENYDEAAEAFRQAYEYSGRGELLFNIGQAYKLAGKLGEAEKYFQQYLEEKPDAKNADEVVNMVIEIQQEVADRMATVQINTDKAGRDVFVATEAEPRCSTPCSLNLNPGSYVLTLKGAGALDKELKITLGPAEKKELNERLELGKVMGRIVVMSDRAGRIRIGTDIDEALPMEAPVSLTAGDYPVIVEAGRATYEGSITVEGESSVHMKLPMQALHDAEKKGSWIKSVSYGFSGAAVGLGVGGMLAGMQAQSTFDELERQEAQNGRVDGSLKEAGANEQTVANTLYFSAVGALVVGASLYVVDEFFLNGESGAAEPTPSPSEDIVPEEEAEPTPAAEPAEEPAEEPESDDGMDLLD